MTKMSKGNSNKTSTQRTFFFLLPLFPLLRCSAVPLFHCPRFRCFRSFGIPRFCCFRSSAVPLFLQFRCSAVSLFPLFRCSAVPLFRTRPAIDDSSFFIRTQCSLMKWDSMCLSQTHFPFQFCKRESLSHMPRIEPQRRHQSTTMILPFHMKPHIRTWASPVILPFHMKAHRHHP